MGQSHSNDQPSPSRQVHVHPNPNVNAAKEGATGERRQSQSPAAARHKPLSTVHYQKHGPAAPPPPPTATLVSSTGPAQASVSALHATVNSPRQHTSSSVMGANESKQQQQRPPSRANTLNSPASGTTTSSTTTSPPDKHASSPKQIPAPALHQVISNESGRDEFSPTYGLPAPNYSRPPRLPLPIEEELHVPGSPIISPQDILSPIDADDIEGTLPRRASITSSAVDEDDEGDDAFAPDQALDGLKVPYTFEWHFSGLQVFVTGTFVQWERKLKLHKNRDGRTGFSATVNLSPGTHHLKFLVDGDMHTSPNLPTTVDWGNNLVNYIEIVAQPPHAADEKQPPAPSEPVPIPGAAVTAGQAEPTDEPAARPKTQLPDTAAVDVPSTSHGVAERINEKLSSHPPRPIDIPGKATSDKKKSDELHQEQQQQQKPLAAPPKKFVPRATYTNEIPQFLQDLDLPKEDEAFQRASRIVDHLPPPPSLPQFLSKSILNGATPHKDDASVLVMPNHTVLNHLATSSIKQGVLATSGTTRYKRKFLTTIMYKPTSKDG